MIVVINGSPNLDSKTLGITKEIIKYTDKEINYVDAYTVNVESCDDCKYCKFKIGCIKKDDMEFIYELLYKADTLIISSPVYFGGMTDKVMKIINRFQRFFEQKYSMKNNDIPKFHNLIVVSTQGGADINMFNGIYETFKILNLLFTPDYSDIVTAPSTDMIHPLEQENVLAKIKEIQKKMIT